MNKIRNFVASLHTHVRSLYDADIAAAALCAKIKEMGGAGCAITDHGSLSAIEDYRRVFTAEGLKLIPGCELYVDGGILGRLHLIVLAKNDNGYIGISKMVTESNRNLQSGYPVITVKKLFEIASQYKGDVIATSACMQGVISAVFLQNGRIQKKIDALKKSQSKYLTPTNAIVSVTNETLKKAEAEYSDAIMNRDETKTMAERSVKTLETKLAKAKKAGKDISKLEAFLEATKRNIEVAKEKLPSVKAQVEEARKAVVEAKKANGKVQESVEKYCTFAAQIAEASKKLKTDAELFDAALATAREYKNVFGADFYVEIQYHGIAAEAECYPMVVRVAKELNIPVVATNDTHILNQTDDERLKRQILRSLRFGETFEAESEGDSELYLKNNTELREWLIKILPEDTVDEAIENIEVIFNSCNVDFKTGKHYPKFSQTEDANQLLIREVKKNIPWRFPQGLTKEYKDRLNYEYSIIKKMGYADYHLIVKDFLEYGRLLGYVPNSKLAEAPLSIDELKMQIAENGWKNQGYVIGPGRGSAAGSLICYLLGITNLDPIKYGLLFERFLNPERISMPDIDSDISATTRQKVIEYVRNRYGNDAVCGIMTITKQAPKGSINIAAKYYGLKTKGEAMTGAARIITKDVPNAANTSFSTKVTKEGQLPGDRDRDEDLITLEKFLYTKYDGNEDAKEVIRWATIIENSFTAYGAHAAGIVISDNKDISDYLPLRMNPGLAMMTTQCDMMQVEENGLLKFDFLGLKTLDIITDAIRMIEKNHGIIIDPLAIDIADKNVYKHVFAAGKTNSVFQFESVGMKNMLTRFNPENFEDLIILVSMFRPGPLQFIDEVIDVKNGIEPMRFLCPELEPILSKTYAAIVYQEQVMEIFQKLAGYSFGGADTVRRYMSKKKADKLTHERDTFINGDAERGIVGCVANGIHADVAEELFEQMSDFAKYAFNKSHAACYAFNAYITAWLKYYYPAEFFTAALNWADQEDYSGLMYEASSMGVKVLAPDVNKSEKEFSCKDGVILFGLSSVKGVKDHANDILSERENGTFLSLKDFVARVMPNATVINNLIAAGALDSFHGNRAAMVAMVKEIADVCKKISEKAAVVASCDVLMPVINSLSTSEDVVKVQIDAGLTATIKGISTADKLQSRRENAKNALTAAKCDLDCVVYHNISEDKEARLNTEQELLGMYVSEHPMDYYPTATEKDVPVVSEVSEGDVRIYGVVTNLVVKARKSDGAQMAFFKVEDRSGNMEVVMFAKAYAKYLPIINNGTVLLLSGECKEEIDNDVVKRQFIATCAETVEAKKPAIIIPVSSYAVFHLEHEAAFREEYESDGDGRPFLVYDKELDEIREMSYRVRECAKNIPEAEEVRGV